MKKIISAGHICLDITPVFPSGRTYPDPGSILVPGSLIQMDGATVHTGGSVANTGLAMKELGADVTLLGKTGSDAFGNLVRDIAASYGAGGLIEDPSCNTSYSVVISVPGFDRVFLHDPGANNTFRSGDIPDSAFEDAELIHFGYPPIMKSIYSDNGNELKEIFTRAKARGLKTSLDMCSVDPSSEAGRVDWRSFLENVLPLTDYFLPSLDEISFMLGIEDKEEIASECLKLGADVAVIKCGEEGMYYKTGSESGMQDAFRAPFVASATGAGDASIAAFLVAVMSGYDIREAVALAAAEGSCAVTTYDALSGLKAIDELEEIIKNAR